MSIASRHRLAVDSPHSDRSPHLLHTRRGAPLTTPGRARPHLAASGEGGATPRTPRATATLPRGATGNAHLLPPRASGCNGWTTEDATAPLVPPSQSTRRGR